MRSQRTAVTDTSFICRLVTVGTQPVTAQANSRALPSRNGHQTLTTDVLPAVKSPMIAYQM
ncbi:hypothetical protein QQF64_035197, partial [Cirrhinus molitorella]